MLMARLRNSRVTATTLLFSGKCMGHTIYTCAWLHVPEQLAAGGLRDHRINPRTLDGASVTPILSKRGAVDVSGTCQQSGCSVKATEIAGDHCYGRSGVGARYTTIHSKIYLLRTLFVDQATSLATQPLATGEPSEVESIAAAPTQHQPACNSASKCLGSLWYSMWMLRPIMAYSQQQQQPWGDKRNSAPSGLLCSYVMVHVPVSQTPCATQRQTSEGVGWTGRSAAGLSAVVAAAAALHAHAAALHDTSLRIDMYKHSTGVFVCR